MAPSLCTRCLRRSLATAEAASSSPLPQRAAFSTSAALANVPPKKKAAAQVKDRSGGTLRLGKNIRSSTGKPPAVGERKAVRKRVVLSNTNALEVQGLQDLTADKLVSHEEGDKGLEGYCGQVVGFGEQTVDALRALEAFKPTQGWNLFRRPASLIRKETTELANDLARAEGEAKERVGKVISGERGGGKSVLLLQAQAMALLKGWVVIHFPEAKDLTDGQTAYRPLDGNDSTVYIQPQYTAQLLSRLAKANEPVLSRMRLSQEHSLPVPVQSNISLSRFAEMGARDPQLAWPIFDALWTELTTPTREGEGLQRPPVLMTMDGLDHAMYPSAYLDPSTKRVHAHDLALIGRFVSVLSGQAALPNGGTALASTTASHRVASPTLDFHLKLADAWQKIVESNKEEPRRGWKLPLWDRYDGLRDARVDAALEGVRVMRSQGLSKTEARGVMEYYAKSGMMRGSVTDGLVSEKWTLAGAGVIGELEKGAVRARF